MSIILTLTPEDREKLHPAVVKRFEETRAGIDREVPLDAVSDEDLNNYLADDEKHEFDGYMRTIGAALTRCLDVGADEPVDSIILQFVLLRFDVSLVTATFGIKSLLRKIHECKMQEAKEERRRQEQEARQQEEEARKQQEKQEEDERCQVAYIALRPSIRAAETFLNAEEYNEFEESIIGAVDAILDRGKEYLSDRRAYDYHRWLDEIQIRREKEERENAARAEAHEYGQLLGAEVKKLQARLSPKKRGTKDYFDEHIEDPRYTKYTFAGLLPEDRRQVLNTALKKIIRPKLDQLVSGEFRQFISWIYYSSYFLLPSANYSHTEASCLSFHFDVFAVIRAEISLEPGEATFDGYTFPLETRDEEGILTTLEIPEFLGHYYVLITPDALGCVFWQTIPLILIRGLTSGDTEPQGTTILKASEAEIVYRVEDYEDEVVIPANFASYLKGIGGIDHMVDIGIIDEKVAGIVRKRLGEMEAKYRGSLPSGEQAAEFQDKLPRKRGKKAKAYELFGEGKVPTSPEMKALGLHKSTRHKYFNAWIADGRPLPLT